MSGSAEIAPGVYLVGGPNISRAEDATAFVIRFPDSLVMIDSGCGRSTGILERNMGEAGLDPGGISLLILTHCHIDHVGGAPYFREIHGARLAMHALDADAVEQGDPVRTAAHWYDMEFPPTPVDLRFTGSHEVLPFGGEELHVLHTPGHTPGSVSLYLDRGGKRILFGQDVHGPFLPAFGSNLDDWRVSMEKLLDLKADILCEGHFGIFPDREKVERYLRKYLREYS
ncbi:MAG TPA: MBL fold metallo-hydrolase [Syntrophales bacterium]|nr:MBL fold metallo-hydrolase [Syntrophales bacterium]HQN78769.1 MBL fold metallo-hydrolase [Syntrophales bacterium]HQQ27811.1 MBL fold metallo-hydrolase [Syntrophales bacterium]